MIVSWEKTKKAEIGPYQVSVTLTADINGKKMVQNYDIIIVITEQESYASSVPGQQEQDDSVTIVLELSIDADIFDEPIKISELDFSDHQAVKETIAKAFGVKNVEKKL